MDRSLPVESTPQIDFENTRDEDVDITSRKGYVDYSERNFTDLFNISDDNNIDEDQYSRCSDNESDAGTNESEADEVPPKKRKRENNSKWSATKPKSKLKRRSACDLVKGAPGPRLDARLVKNELETFLLYINENMITKITGRTNDQMHKVRIKINSDEFLFRCSDTNEEEIKCLFGLLYFRALYYHTKQPTKELSSDTFSTRKIYRTSMSLNRYEWLMKTITFHDHNTV